MKRFLILFVLLMLALPAFAQTPAPTPYVRWGHLDEEIILNGTFARGLDNKIHGQLSAAWAHYVTESTEVGAVIAYMNDPGVASGQSAGGFYEYNLPNLRKGHLFLGGDASYLTGNWQDLATASATFRLGYKLHIGTSSALRVAVEQVKPIIGVTEESDPLNQTRFVVGFSMGIKQNTVIQ